jgi:RNA polymerase sigma factor (sigma-70 family)
MECAIFEASLKFLWRILLVGSDMLPDMSDTDLELLARYTRQHAEDAFVELVRRHLGLVYSAALRQVCSPQLAEEVSQSVFTDLVRNATRLKPNTVLSAWLYQVTRRTAIDVVRREASRQLREQVATEMNAMNATAADWTHIEPLLDEAMHALDETDRAAVLLRYFENKSLREVGATLGTSENAAQKRLSRAVERLREFLAKRGVTVGTSGLVVIISVNAVQAAPIGLFVTVSTGAALGGTAIAAAATATATKTIAMTVTQKVLITTVLAAAVGTGIYEARQASTLRTQIQTLQQAQASLAGQVDQLNREREDASRRLAALTAENERLNRNPSELLKLRGEVGLLRQQNQSLAQAATDRTKTNQSQLLSKGFGTLGEYLPSEDASNAGNSTPEALLKTFIYAMRKGDVPLLEKFGAPLTGQSEPGDVVGAISESKTALFKTLQNLFTNAAGFRLSSKTANNGQSYEVRLDADPLPGTRDESFKNFFLSMNLERKDNGWTFGAPPSDSQTK